VARWHDAIGYLLMRGETGLAYDLVDPLYQRWRSQLGDGPATLRAATSIAEALRSMGRHAEARELDEDVLARRRCRYGDDHFQTLASASNLAVDLYQLGEVQAARDWDEDTLDRRRGVLGPDHPDTLTSASNLAADLRALGEPDNKL
jgi:hypothetical protein